MPDVAESLDALLAGASEPSSIADGDGKSGARLERVVIDGESYVVKHISRAEDWTMRGAGQLWGAPLVLWRRGLLAQLPDCLNQPIVGVALERDGCALLMRDVGQWLVPVDDGVIPLEQHLGFLDHMAALHAAFWAGGDQI
jgi:hypothetical protein